MMISRERRVIFKAIIDEERIVGGGGGCVGERMWKECWVGERGSMRLSIANSMHLGTK